MRNGIAIALLLTAAACAPPQQQNHAYPSPSSPSQPPPPTLTVRITDDQFRPNIDYTVLPRMEVGRDVVSLGARRNRATGSLSYDVIYSAIYTAPTWIFYASARDERANELAFRSGGRDVSCGGGGCAYSEISVITIPEASLRAAAQTNTPFRLKIFGQTRETVLTIPVNYIQALLAGVRPQPRGSAAATPPSGRGAHSSAEPPPVPGGAPR